MFTPPKFCRMQVVSAPRCVPVCAGHVLAAGALCSGADTALSAGVTPGPEASQAAGERTSVPPSLHSRAQLLHMFRGKSALNKLHQ